MKTFALAIATAALTAQAAFAGSLAEPKVEAPVIVAETTDSSAGTALPLLMTAMVVYVAVTR